MKNELQTMRLFSPLFSHLYRKNEPEDLTSEELLEYEDVMEDYKAGQDGDF